MKEEKMLLRFQRDAILKPLTQMIGFVERHKFRGISGYSYKDVLTSISHNLPVIYDTIEKHPYITLGICTYSLSRKAIRKILNSVGVKLCAKLDVTTYIDMKKNGTVNNFNEFLNYKKSLREKSSSDDEDSMMFLSECKFIRSPANAELFLCIN